MSEPMRQWHKSSHSGNQGHCLEAREHTTGADIRDTQNRELGHLGFSGSAWAALLRTLTE